MKIKDITKRFMDNSQKVKKTIVLHWTGGATAESAIDWLDKRRNGDGSVGYNYIIDDDIVYILAQPYTRWMHNSGLGTNFDKDTISISFVGIKGSDITDKQLELAKELIKDLKLIFDIERITHHRNLNKGKPDFPLKTWRRINGKMADKEV